jgi:hypothetical protein
VSFGHRFHKRVGHGDKNYLDQQRSPVFLQFMDCVYQIISQNPCAFEFGEKLLITIVDAMFSCQYGTFLFDSDQEREKNKLKDLTPSLWSYVNSNLHEFANPFYVPDSIVVVDANVDRFVIWRNLYLRWSRKQTNEIMTPEMRFSAVQLQANEMAKKVKDLEKLNNINSPSVNNGDNNNNDPQTPKRITL